MKYAEAFKSLGYELDVPRQDWTAANGHGVCLSLWIKEISGHGKDMRFASKEHGGTLENWIDKPGNLKRIKHLEKALAEHDGWVDVIRVDGIPGEGYGDADPWHPKQRREYKWRITELESATGHFRAEIQKCENPL